MKAQAASRRLILVAILFFLIPPQPARGSDDGSGWSAEIVTASFRGKITTTLHEIIPDPGFRLLEVVGYFAGPGPTPGGPVKEIFASGPEPNLKAPAAAIGLVGKNGRCVYLVATGFTGYVDLEFAETGEGLTLGRPGDDDPMTVALMKKQCRLCLAFIVPEDQIQWRLGFFGTETLLPKPEGLP